MTPGRAAFVAAVLVALLAACWLVCRALASPEPAETPMPRPACRDCNEYIRPAGEHDEEWTHVIPLPTWPQRAEPLGGDGL